MSRFEERSGDAEWIAFRVALEEAIGVPLHQYKEPQMKRRLASLMQRRGYASWPQFTRAIANPVLLADVRDTLTINVSEFFRQADRFQELQQRVLPELMARRRPLRLWSAGCSNGCEPYTLAIVLNELDPTGGHSVLGTDVDMPILAKARDGRGYSPADVRSVPPGILAKYFVRESATYAVSEAVKRRVTFRRHDLLSDPYPRDMDLILCRNVVIYFTEAAKQQIYAKFSAALRPGGYLFVGGSEMIMRPDVLGFRTTGTSLYQRAA